MSAACVRACMCAFAFVNRGKPYIFPIHSKVVCLVRGGRVGSRFLSNSTVFHETNKSGQISRDVDRRYNEREGKPSDPSSCCWHKLCELQILATAASCWEAPFPAFPVFLSWGAKWRIHTQATQGNCTKAGLGCGFGEKNYLKFSTAVRCVLLCV